MTASCTTGTPLTPHASPLAAKPPLTPHASRLAAKPQRGFSLIELLAVIVIITVVSSVALLSIDLGGPQAKLRDEAHRLSGLLELLCEESMFRSREQGLVLVDGGYAFSQWDGEQWIHHPDRMFRIRELEPGFSARLSVDGRTASSSSETAAAPQVMCFSSGEMTPFQLELLGPSQSALTLEGDALGRLRVEQLR